MRASTTDRSVTCISSVSYGLLTYLPVALRAASPVPSPAAAQPQQVLGSAVMGFWHVACVLTSLQASLSQHRDSHPRLWFSLHAMSFWTLTPLDMICVAPVLHRAIVSLSANNRTSTGGHVQK